MNGKYKITFRNKTEYADTKKEAIKTASIMRGGRDETVEIYKLCENGGIDSSGLHVGFYEPC